MEYLKELDSRPLDALAPAGITETRPSHSRTRSYASIPHRSLLSERAPLLTRSRSQDAFEPDEIKNEEEQALGGGTVLGIHNLAIVAPQFIVSYDRL